MSFVTWGLSHKTAPIAIRERFYFSKEKMADALRELKSRTLVNDAVILSTCNRTEIYCSSVSDPNVIPHWLAQYHHLSVNELAPYLYFYKGEESIKHVFRVASGMDSMVVGEPQIFGQIKEAYSIAEKTGAVNGTFRKLFQHVFSVGKKIRTETEIGVNPVSLGQVILDLVRKKIKDLSEMRVLLIGAGETIESISRSLDSFHVKDICIANRTLSKARAIADKINARVCTLNDAKWNEADLIISAVNCSLSVIRKENVMKESIKNKNKKTKKLFFDLGVPRNISEDIKINKNIFLYSLDDLKKILEENREKRLSAVSAAEAMLDEYAKNFILSLRSLSVTDAVKKYRYKMHEIRDDFLQRSLLSLQAGEEPEKIIEKLAHQLTNKFLHAPTVNLKKAACQDNWILVHAVEKLWNI